MPFHLRERSFSIAAVLLLNAGIAGCASESIRSDYDPAANLGGYRTFDFVPISGLDETAHERLYAEQLVGAISMEMEKRGFVKSENPDLLISFDAMLLKTTKVVASPPPLVGGYEGYRGDFYDPWLGYGYVAQSFVLQQTKSAFNIDLVDARRMRPVWAASGYSDLGFKGLEDFDQRIYERIPKYFSEFPFRAGSGFLQPR